MRKSLRGPKCQAEHVHGASGAQQGSFPTWGIREGCQRERCLNGDLKREWELVQPNTFVPQQDYREKSQGQSQNPAIPPPPHNPHPYSRGLCGATSLSLILPLSVRKAGINKDSNGLLPTCGSVGGEMCGGFILWSRAAV